MALWQAQTGQVQGFETVHVDLRDSWKANTSTGVIHFFLVLNVWYVGEHVARIWDTRNAYKISKRKLKGNGLLGSPWYTSRQQGDSQLFLHICRGSWYICLRYGTESTVTFVSWSYGLWHPSVWYTSVTVSEEQAASIFKVYSLKCW